MGRNIYREAAMREMFRGVFEIEKHLATEDIFSAGSVYGEKIVQQRFRLWNPYRSKLAAAIKKGLKHFPLSAGSKVLYLGASTGTTVSHISDIIGRDGIVYAVEISPHSMKKLLMLCQKRENIIPLLADARKADYNIGEVDVLYQDVAQQEQAEILIKNAMRFLKDKGYALFAVKSQSIDVLAPKEKVFDEVIKKIDEHFQVVEKIQLYPFDKDHLFLVLKKKQL